MSEGKDKKRNPCSFGDTLKHCLWASVFDW